MEIDVTWAGTVTLNFVREFLHMSISPVVEVYLSGDTGWLGDGLGEEGREAVPRSRQLSHYAATNPATKLLPTSCLSKTSPSTLPCLPPRSTCLSPPSSSIYFPQHWGSVGWLSYYAATNPATKLFWPPCPRPRRWLRPADKIKKMHKFTFDYLNKCSPNRRKFNSFNNETAIVKYCLNSQFEPHVVVLKGRRLVAPGSCQLVKFL